LEHERNNGGQLNSLWIAKVTEPPASWFSQNSHPEITINYLIFQTDKMKNEMTSIV